MEGFNTFLYNILQVQVASKQQQFGSSFSFPLSNQLFIGFGFPYEGPAPLEAIANGYIFLQPMFKPSHSSLNHEFFKGKPTSRQVSRLSLWWQWTVSILLRK
jgi:hypothetical protein